MKVGLDLKEILCVFWGSPKMVSYPSNGYLSVTSDVVLLDFKHIVRQTVSVQKKKHMQNSIYMLFFKCRFYSQNQQLKKDNTTQQCSPSPKIIV